MKEPAHPKPLRFLVIGAGSRGTAYGRAVTAATTGTIHAVAEPHAFQRDEFGRNFIWGDAAPKPGQSFADWKDWLAWEQSRRDQNHPEGEEGEVGVDGVFICTLDETHVDILLAIAPLNLHILCEKPLALSLRDCLSVYRALAPQTVNDDNNNDTTQQGKIFSIGHVLRYSPHNILLRQLLLVDKAIGDIVSLEHCEPVGWWHFSHSYVRGNWRRETATGDGSLLTKSCHDIDFIMWLLSSPAPSSSSTSQIPTRVHHPRTITSSGALTQFRQARKPPAAGSATNCLSCPAEPECNYSAVKIYRDMHTAKGWYDWPVKIVCPDIEDVARSASDSASAKEAASRHLLQKLEEDYTPETADEAIAARPWYGRCVYESDNSVCDDQVVTITWDDEEQESPGGQGQEEDERNLRPAKTAVFHMIAPTEKQCERRGRVYGTHGELSYDSRTITIYSFATRTSRVVEVPRQPPEEERSHGGGDYGLARSFVRAVDAVENGAMGVEEAQRGFVGCTLEEAVRSHAVVFAAEEARREERVVRWKEWWEKALASAATPLS
ncbi:hypothetical protein FE257_007985 [Aspergillus nanangensis]|uniref:NAD binding Rossmann fold oxidoreductase n=1 Tax=Aspergillus nanangensis TaxID=2582783 RepID=A0AAD4CNK2_ASPNN|nr:hypothetical protein FE257_007985 [Aspergillus nanangensis]